MVRATGERRSLEAVRGVGWRNFRLSLSTLVPLPFTRAPALTAVSRALSARILRSGGARSGRACLSAATRRLPTYDVILTNKMRLFYTTRFLRLSSARTQIFHTTLSDVHANFTRSFAMTFPGRVELRSNYWSLFFYKNALTLSQLSLSLTLASEFHALVGVFKRDT